MNDIRRRIALAGGDVRPLTFEIDEVLSNHNNDDLAEVVMRDFVLSLGGTPVNYDGQFSIFMDVPYEDYGDQRSRVRTYTVEYTVTVRDEASRGRDILMQASIGQTCRHSSTVRRECMPSRQDFQKLLLRLGD